MSYVLKENNGFYGSKGDMISDKLYSRLPSQHQLLFKKYDSNSSEYDNLMDKIKNASLYYDNLPRPVRLNRGNANDVLENPLYNQLYNQLDGFMVKLEEDDEELEDNEPF